MSPGHQPAHILLVEDNEKLVNMYEKWLSEDYRVETALSGSEALDKLNESVDIVFLDRKLGDMTGGEVLDEVTAQGLNPYVVLLTRLKPDIEIIQRQHDAYLEKPVSRELLHEIVQTIRERATYNGYVREWAGVQTKISVLEKEMTPTRREDSAFMQELYRYREKLEEEMDKVGDDLDHLFVDPDEFDPDTEAEEVEAGG